MLRRHLAPASDAAWSAIDAEVRDTLKALLVGRRVVDVDGPRGWDFAALNLGTFDVIPDSAGVTAGLRAVQRAVEVRTPFHLPQIEIDAVDRGGRPTFDAAVDAARKTALREDAAIFHGWADAAIEGITQASSHDRVPLPAAAAEVPHAVVRAVGALHGAGVDGPYELVMGTQAYQAVSSATPQGFPIRRLLVKQLEGGDVHHTPAVDGAILLSRRGGDFELSLGHDLAVGYVSHDRQDVELYVTESFAFRVLDGDAAVVLA